MYMCWESSEFGTIFWNECWIQNLTEKKPKQSYHHHTDLNETNVSLFMSFGFSWLFIRWFHLARSLRFPFLMSTNKEWRVSTLFFFVKQNWQHFITCDQRLYIGLLTPEIERAIFCQFWFIVNIIHYDIRTIDWENGRNDVSNPIIDPVARKKMESIRTS